MAYAWLLILLPFAGSIWLALRGRRMSEAEIGRVAVTAVGAAFAVSVLCFIHLSFRHGAMLPIIRFHGLLPDIQMVPAAFIARGPVWIAAGDLTVGFRLLLDPLSVAMAMMVTGVATLIHLYARGYMHGDENYPRFFALLNLFVGAMLTLVLAENLPLMFIGWEGVGFCSYMLIGYYTKRHSASQAGKKAFIVNRIGDLGFLLGTFLCWRAFGSLSFPTIVHEAPRLFGEGDGRMFAIALCFFVGAVGKSAQFPLYVWLPDAMEGPTPVSALIHAATMVTAGVYLVVRLAVIYALAPAMMTIVAAVGLFTALLAALLAMVQNDIKKVLAYSTISQLGYMFLAVGVGAYVAAMFHLLTHAFFKGLLFLCSGSVIHGVEHAMQAAGEEKDPQDMRNMGGLKDKMPTTHWTMFVGAAAISGVPLLSGFFSKDEILYYTGQKNWVLLIVGLAVALLTAFYMFRLIFKTFWRETRLSRAVWDNLKESEPTMTTPLVVLAILSLFGGLLNLPGHSAISQSFAKWLAPTMLRVDAILHPHGLHGDFGAELRGMVISSVIALLGIGVAFWFYYRSEGRGAALAARYSTPYRWLTHLYYLDAFYQKYLIQPGHRFAEWLARALDQELIDGLVNGVARFFGASAEQARRYQPGFVRSYALWFSLGALLLLGYLSMRGAPQVVVVMVGLLVTAMVGFAAWVVRPREEV